MGETIKWSAFEDTDVDSFKVYRAITGFTVSFPNSLTVGDKLIFAATSPTIQTVTLSAVDIDSVVAIINAQAKGISAVKNDAGNAALIRANAATNPKLKLYACSFITNTSQAARLIGPRTEFAGIATVPFVEGTFEYSYEDVDGSPLDWYHLTTLTGSVESIPSLDQAPVITPENMCVIEGRLIDLQNRPIVGATVNASVVVPIGLSDNAGVTPGSISTITDSLGRWSLPLLQEQQILFQIETLGYNQVIKVPTADFVLFENLKPVDDNLFAGAAGDPLVGIPSGTGGLIP